MAGYIFTLDSMESLQQCFGNGIYGTFMKHPKGDVWGIHHEGTFADYCGMKQGDNIYFFIKRKIYGIGELIDISNDCKFLNYPDALVPNPNKHEQKTLLYNSEKDSYNQRCICFFKPHPNFFKVGVDMDEILLSNPNSFKMLRAFWKLSFIKIDDVENKALFDIILKSNELAINKPDEVYYFDEGLHNEIRDKEDLNKYLICSNTIVDLALDSTTRKKLKHEMAIEVAIIDLITRNRIDVFGQWDYISHQVVASPFKPIDYMDKMDVFGYKYIKGFKTISKYLTIEIKKDNADKDSINQVMKYVDWISQEYAFGDYNMIESYIVAFDFSQEVIEYTKEICKRNYIKVRKPYENGLWKNIKLIKYSYNESIKQLVFEEVSLG